MFDIENVFFDVEAKDYTELFTKMADIFKTKGYINDGYLESIIEREKNYPTGLLFDGYSVAIPHTKAEFIKEEKIVFVRLKNEIEFIEMGTTDSPLNVKVIIMLLIKKGDKQIETLLKLMKILENKENYNILNNSNNKTEIINLLEN